MHSPRLQNGVRQEGAVRLSPKPVRTAIRVLALLEALADAPQGTGPTELSRELGLDKATITRLLATLVEAGFAQQDIITRRYSLTAKVVRLAHRWSSDHELGDVARGLLTWLRDQSNETVHLGILEGDSVVYIDKLESRSSIRLVSAIGTRVPVSTSALGKAILLGMTPEDRSSFVAELPMPTRTPRSITSAERLLESVAQAEVQGYTVDDQENETGVCCVGAPLFGASGSPVGAISMSGPAHRVGPRVAQLGPMCRECAEGISRELGYVVALPKPQEG